MKRIALIFAILIGLQLGLNLLFCKEKHLGEMSIYQEGWSKSFTYEVVNAILHFRQDMGRMPLNLTELRPSYLHDPDILIPTGAKIAMGLEHVSLKKFPEAMDISGAIQIYKSPNDDSFFVIISPVLFGSKHIPIRFWNSDRQNFEILPLEEVKVLISKYEN